MSAPEGVTIDLAGMDRVDFLKYLAIYLLQEYEFSKDAPLITKLVAVTRELAGEELVSVEGEPEAESPNDSDALAKSITDILYHEYIRFVASRRKAAEVTVKILEALTNFYEEEEQRQILAQQGGQLQ